MKLVYIAGPYSDANGYHAIERNIMRAREAADYLAHRGVGYICPHLNSAHFEVIAPDLPREYWLALGLRLLEGCDAVFLLDHWQYSDGSLAEKQRAEELEIPVFEYAHLFGLSGSESRGAKWLEAAKDLVS